MDQNMSDIYKLFQTVFAKPKMPLHPIYDQPPVRNINKNNIWCKFVEKHNSVDDPEMLEALVHNAFTSDNPNVVNAVKQFIYMIKLCSDYTEPKLKEVQSKIDRFNRITQTVIDDNSKKKNKYDLALAEYYENIKKYNNHVITTWDAVIREIEHRLHIPIWKTAFEFAYNTHDASEIFISPLKSNIASLYFKNKKKEISMEDFESFINLFIDAVFSAYIKSIKNEIEIEFNKLKNNNVHTKELKKLKDNLKKINRIPISTEQKNIWYKPNTARLLNSNININIEDDEEVLKKCEEIRNEIILYYHKLYNETISNFKEKHDKNIEGYEIDPTVLYGVSEVIIIIAKDMHV
jgi:hypothetical protein